MLFRGVSTFFLIVFVFSLGRAQEYQRIDSALLQNGCRTFHIQEKTLPLDIYVLEVDLTNKKNKIKTGLANDKIAWIDPAGETFVNKETVGHMIDRRSNDGETVIAGINADFFNMANGMQFNVTATGGEIASYGITPKNHAALYVDDSGEPYIETINLQQKVVIPGVGQHEITGINIIRYDNYLVLYNHFTGLDKSFANQWGVECLLEPLDSGLINGVRTYRILEIANNVTMTKTNQIILSGIGAARTFLDQTSVGQVIQINSVFSGLANKRIVEMVGGWGHIIQEGKNCAVSSIEEEGTMSHEEDRHPRTAAGFNKDKTKMYLVAIDGRSDISIGVNLSQLADFMIDELDVWEGLNFDGGGSTTLMAGTQTLNNPSGGVQRAIANALLVVEGDSVSQTCTYDFETSSTTTTVGGDNLFYEQDLSNRSGVWVLELDRTKGRVDFSPAWANKRIGYSDAFGIEHKSEQLLSEIIAETDQEQDSMLIGAINGSPFDFTSDAVYGLTATGGMITTLPDTGIITPALWFNEDNEPFISDLSAEIKVTASNNSEFKLSDVNGVRWLDYMVLYNSFMGNNTGTNQWGAEVLLEPKEEMFINSSVAFEVKEKVSSKENGTGKMPLEEGKLVLSGNGDAYEFIRDNINVGENIQITSQILGADGQKVKHIISGAGILFKNGEEYHDDFATSRTWQPVLGNDLRAAIGYNTDKSKVYLFASDEFNESNIGLPLPGLVELMKKYEISDGLLLEGGSSVTMYAGDELVNTTPENETLIPNGMVVKLMNITGNSIIKSLNDIRVFPNPVTDKLYIETGNETGENLEFRLFDQTGRAVISRTVSPSGISTLDVSEVNNGIYFFELVGQNQNRKNGKLIITKNK